MSNRTEGQASRRPALDQVGEIVRRYFDAPAGELHVGGLPISTIVREFGSPIFVYDHQTLLDKVRSVRSTLPPDFALYYSIKANPNASVLKCMLAEGCGLEVASAGELYQAIMVECPRSKIVFAGPGKTRDELQYALSSDIGEIHVESLDEARCLNQLAETSGSLARVALRINPVSGAGGAMRMGGLPSPFGIDEEELDGVLTEMLSLPRLHINGAHLFMGTQILNAETLLSQYERALEIARRIAHRLPHPLQTVDFGGGWGTPYFANEQPLDLTVLAAGLANLEQQMKADSLLAHATGILEPGRFLVNEAGIYITRVTRVKKSRGKCYAVVDGGMHHHLAASGNLGQTIKRNYPVAVLNRMHEPHREKINVVGPLCTPLDMLAREAELPRVQPGDLIGVFQSGAYARTASPHGFLSHASPAEVMIHEGKATLVRQPGSPADFLRDQ